MSYTNVRIHESLMQQIEARKTGWQSTTAIVNDLLASALDTGITLNWPSRQAPGPTDRGEGHLKEEDKDVDFSVALRAEEAHVPPAAIKSPGKVTKEVPEALKGHETAIRAYWAAKPKTKTLQAWKLLMTELTKIKDRYGDSVVNDQLGLAEANRWKGITLRNYEQFGMARGNTPTEPLLRHPAHQVFVAEGF